jgi:endonuclease NucS-like protein
MALYERSVRLLMRDMVAEIGLKKGQVITREEVVNWFAQRYPRVKRGTVTAHLILLSTNAPSRVHHGAKADDDLFFQMDGGNFRLYDPSVDPAPIYPGNSILKTGPTPEGDEPEPISEFAYESDLRDFLAKNLPLIEPGLRLYQEEGITGIEFPAGGRFIDILAIDSKNNFVVIELKVSKGYDRVVGQLLRYVAWIAENHADTTQKVRGVIVAREISADLILACSRVSDVELYEYQLSVKLGKVERKNREA